MKHYTLGANNMAVGATGWKRETLHTRCKQHGSRGHWVEAWDSTVYTLNASKLEAGATGWKRETLHTRCKQDESRDHWLEAWDTTH